MSDKALKYTELTDEIGAELRRIRTEKKLTLMEVASALCENGRQLSNVHLSRIETGQRRIDDDLLRVLCDYYQTDPGELVIGACRSHISRILSLHPSSQPASDSLAATIESVLTGMNETGQNESARLLQYFSQIESFRK